MVITLYRSCSWCRNIVRLHAMGPTFCVSCSHRADLPRMDCTCGRCQPTDEPTRLDDSFEFYLNDPPIEPAVAPESLDF